MIETNEPMTESREHAKPPEGDLVETARNAGAAAQERLGAFRDAAVSSSGRSKVRRSGEGRRNQGPGCRRDRPSG